MKVAVAVTIAVLSIALAAFVTAMFEPVPVCLYRLATGHLCIFCGMTHALAHVAHGAWREAYAANPAWFVLLPAFVLTVVARRSGMSWTMVALVILGTLLRW